MTDQAELERQYFARGKEICGPKAGGLLANLLRAKSGNVALARMEIERASQKENPREYLAKIARPKASGAVGNGAAEDWNRKAGAMLKERAAGRPPTEAEKAAVARKLETFKRTIPPDAIPPRFTTGQPTPHASRIKADLERRANERCRQLAGQADALSAREEEQS